jgi:ATP-binding cassette subfamily B (MDR/TAP) protein 1
VQVYFCLTVTAMAVSKTIALGPDTSKARDSTASIFEILDSKPKIDSSNNDGTILETVKGDIELQQIKFRYPTRPNIQIFEDLCLSIPAGKVIKNKFINLIRLNFIYTISINVFYTDNWDC